MTENVVSLRPNARVFAPGEPDPDIVRFCEQLLDEARCGKLRAIAIATVYEGNRNGTGWSGGHATTFALGGSVLMLANRYGQKCVEMPDVGD